MPYVITTKVYAQPTKQGELRALLEGRVRDGQKAGFRLNLATTALGADPSFFVNLFCADLAKADEFRASTQFPANDPAFMGKVTQLVRQPAQNQLLQVLSSPPPAGSPPRYNLVGRIVGQPAHVLDVLDMVRSRVQEEQAAGARVGLSRVVAGEPGLRVARQFGSMAELETWIAATESDASRLQFVRKLTPMLAEPVQYEVREVLIAMPPA